ncbi:Uncharacterised protein [uncultured Comamonas sp.]|nr:Uncharacterised protein [uncultured Comamonas sp.]
MWERLEPRMFVGGVLFETQSASAKKLCASSMNNMKYVIYALLLCFGIIAGIVLYFGYMDSRYLLAVAYSIAPESSEKWKNNFELKQREKMKEVNLDDRINKIQLNDRYYDIPQRYTYGQTIEKYGRWGTPKSERIKVGTMEITVLLPDMRPYFPEDDALWVKTGWGAKVYANITNSLGASDWFDYIREKYINNTYQYYSRRDDVYDLMVFKSNGYSHDTYFPKNDEVQLVISCSKGNENIPDFSPGCQVKSNYSPGIVLKYSYSKEYLPDWMKIDIELKRLFKNFEKTSEN